MLRAMLPGMSRAAVTPKGRTLPHDKCGWSTKRVRATTFGDLLANHWQTAVQSPPGMQQAGCWTRPELLVWGGAPRRNRTGDPILTMDRRLGAVLGRVFAARTTP